MLALQVSEAQITNLIANMDLDSLERVRKAIVKREAYFKRFKKAPIDEIVEDFTNHNYSDGFLKDLENGLKKSRIYNKK